MSTVAPPPPTPPVPPPTSPARAPVLVAVQPPAALVRLAPGTELTATVVGAAGRNMIAVQTPAGPATLQTPVPFPAGATLVLQVQAAVTGQVTLRLESVDGRPPAPAGALAPSLARAGAAPAPPLAAGVAVMATLLRGPAVRSVSGAVPGGPAAPQAGGATAAPTPTAGATGASFPTGQSAAARSAGVPPAPGAGTGSVPAPARTSVAATALVGSPGPPPAAAYSARVPPPSPAIGTQLPLRIVAVQAPAPAAAIAPPHPASAGAPPAPGQTLVGIVTGATADGHPVVFTRAGVFALSARAELPLDSRITFEVTGAPVPPRAPEIGAQPTIREALLLTRDWPALAEAMTVLKEADQALAQAVAKAALPRPDSGLTATMLFFLAALRGGELRSWLGDGTERVLQRERPALLNRLRDDFSSRSRAAEEPGPGEWRIALLPMQAEAAIEQVRLLLRRAPDDEEDEAKRGTRFVVDVTLSRLGRMQLDGLVRDEKRLDLIVRTDRPLPEAMQADIAGIFRDATQATGLTGGLGFQAAPADFVEIPVGPRGTGGGLVV